MLPLLAYHPMQIFFGGCIVPIVKTWLVRERRISLPRTTHDLKGGDSFTPEQIAARLSLAGAQAALDERPESRKLSPRRSSRGLRCGVGACPATILTAGLVRAADSWCTRVSSITPRDASP